MDFMITQNYNLTQLNTLHLQSLARYFVAANSEKIILEALSFAKKQEVPAVILGGGSNVVMMNEINSLIIQNAIPGIKITDENAKYIYLRVGAGVNWHYFVKYCLSHQYYGIENLSLIPGTVGAAPIQNIGAYGVELKEVFHELEAIDIDSNKIARIDLTACKFAYRDSIFKQEYKDRFIVTAVTLRLNKKPEINLNNDALQKELDQAGIKNPLPEQISEAVCRIRKRRLPDPAEIGNAGSFFTNPIISQEKFILIKNKYNDIINYPVDHNHIKISAGWLIDKCGWGGYRENNIGVFAANPLVLVNYGIASGTEILALAEKIKSSVLQEFDIKLEMEPRIY